MTIRCACASGCNCQSEGSTCGCKEGSAPCACKVSKLAQQYAQTTDFDFLGQIKALCLLGLHKGYILDYWPISSMEVRLDISQVLPQDLKLLCVLTLREGFDAIEVCPSRRTAIKVSKRTPHLLPRLLKTVLEQIPPKPRIGARNVFERRALQTLVLTVQERAKELGYNVVIESFGDFYTPMRFEKDGHTVYVTLIMDTVGNYLKVKIDSEFKTASHIFEVIVWPDLFDDMAMSILSLLEG